MALYCDNQLKSITEGIRGADPDAVRRAREYVQTLAAPPGSLGKLTDAAVQLAGITGRVKNRLEKRRIIVLCADNGVVEEGVSVTPPSVTLAQAVNMTKYQTGMSTLAKHFGCEVEVVDVGIYADLPLDGSPAEAKLNVPDGMPARAETISAAGSPAETKLNVPDGMPAPAEKLSMAGCPAEAAPLRYAGAAGGILPRKIRPGTANLYREPAMSRRETLEAIGVGIERARAASQDGIKVIGVGEMGIGNTTTSAAVLSALTGLSIEEVTGRGGGLTDAAFARKKEIIAGAVALHRPDPADPVDVLAKVGGLDLAAMCGVYLGAAACRIPVVVDGFISIVAALCAVRLCPAARDFMFPSHASAEPGYLWAADEIGLSPWLMLNMRLGEGSGCPLAFQILDAACALMNDMATFEDAQIDDGYLEEIRAMENPGTGQARQAGAFS
ncbi:MAG: nicotinate-nucleotide--dimethylbenzimidazole phosphoribosyltransferase [Eubacteriales bacterium]|nr:nicotinate-nucleotide--dimethylbenzimidazole phosphoribosyltransferase [Eubacteriales bacterium]